MHALQLTDKSGAHEWIHQRPGNYVEKQIQSDLGKFVESCRVATKPKRTNKICFPGAFH